MISCSTKPDALQQSTAINNFEENIAKSCLPPVTKLLEIYMSQTT